jgi:hypothetical protein
MKLDPATNRRRDSKDPDDAELRITALCATGSYLRPKGNFLMNSNQWGLFQNRDPTFRGRTKYDKRFTAVRSIPK